MLNDKFWFTGKKSTLAASAIISGSSIAVTSFMAGREFATKTTWNKYSRSLLRHTLIRNKWHGEK